MESFSLESFLMFWAGLLLGMWLGFEEGKRRERDRNK